MREPDQPTLWYLLLLAAVCGIGTAWALTWAFQWGYWFVTGP